MGGSEYYAGLAEGFVDVSPLTDNCAEGTQAIVDAVKELIISGDWDVFSGVKLTYNVGEDGSVEIVQTDADLVDDEGNVIVAAGGASVEDSVIKGSMNYNVEGVVAH
jgi:basic membrane protein A